MFVNMRNFHHWTKVYLKNCTEVVLVVLVQIKPLSIMIIDMILLSLELLITSLMPKSKLLLVKIFRILK
uniref:Uncharacterized protein n=1 Tax=Rhizophagus irregularis (strain DAOM 181602 / DAOM 197198 / MUCL 43194) TaxID=747089 RepID=U9TDJ9_RHIID